MRQGLRPLCTADGSTCGSFSSHCGVSSLTGSPNNKSINALLMTITGTADPSALCAVPVGVQRKLSPTDRLTLNLRQVELKG